MIEEHGFPSKIRMEEEEEEGWSPRKVRRPIGFVHSENEQTDSTEQDAETVGLSTAQVALLKSLADERKIILNDTSLNPRQKQKLLDETRKAIVVASGGTVKKTDSVVYGILIFGGVVLITLSLLTVFAGLPSEVTLSFVGTVLGGTIATIAQKLGKL